MKEHYSTLEIVKALGIPRERLRQWMNEGFVRPSQPSPKQGSRALFTRHDVYAIALFRDLIERGLNRKEAALYVDMWLEDAKKRPVVGAGLYNHLIFCSVIVDGEKKLMFSKMSVLGMPLPDEFAALGGFIQQNIKGSNWDAILVVNFTHIKKVVDSALA